MSRVKEKFCAQFEALLDELMQWRADHPQASLDELAAQFVMVQCQMETPPISPSYCQG